MGGSLALKEPISGVANLTTCIWTSAQTVDYTSVTAYWMPFPSIHIPPWSKMQPRNEHFSLFLPLVKKMLTFNILDKMNSSRFPRSSCAKWDTACVCRRLEITSINYGPKYDPKFEIMVILLLLPVIMWHFLNDQNITALFGWKVLGYFRHSHCTLRQTSKM